VKGNSGIARLPLERAAQPPDTSTVSDRRDARLADPDGRSPRLMCRQPAGARVLLAVTRLLLTVTRVLLAVTGVPLAIPRSHFHVKVVPRISRSVCEHVSVVG